MLRFVHPGNTTALAVHKDNEAFNPLHVHRIDAEEGGFFRESH
jgi:hypothetical protein